MTLFDIAYRCCMLDKYGICNDGARSGVSVAQWCDVRFVMRTLFSLSRARDKTNEYLPSQPFKRCYFLTS